MKSPLFEGKRRGRRLPCDGKVRASGAAERHRDEGSVPPSQRKGVDGMAPREVVVALRRDAWANAGGLADDSTVGALLRARGLCPPAPFARKRPGWITTVSATLSLPYVEQVGGYGGPHWETLGETPLAVCLAWVMSCSRSLDV